MGGRQPATDRHVIAALDARTLQAGFMSQSLDIPVPRWLVHAVGGMDSGFIPRHSVAVNPGWWGRCLTEYGFADEMFEAPGDVLTRAALFDLGRAAGTSPADARRLLWAALSWGTGRRHRLNKSRIASVSKSPDALGKLLAEAAIGSREDPEAAYRLLRPAGNAIRYLGPPFATKFLYFAGGGEPAHPCLILDSRVAASLRNDCGWTSLAGVFSWPAESYGAYSRLLHRWAGEASSQLAQRGPGQVTPDQVEYALFRGRRAFEGVWPVSEGLVAVPSDNAVTRRERRRQSDYREQVLGLPPGMSAGRKPKTLGNYLPADDRRNNFLSDEAAEYAAARAKKVKAEGGQLEEVRLFTNMLSLMPLAFTVFGHLRAHPCAAVLVLSALTGRQLTGLDTVAVGRRAIEGIECEWTPERRDHLNDGTAFDAVVAARLPDDRRLLIAVEVKYIDTFSRDRKDETGEKDGKYALRCRDFGMADTAFEALRGHRTRQLLRNVLLTDSVRRGGRSGPAQFDEALTVAFARDDDTSARCAVAEVGRQRGAMPTGVTFLGHGEFADAPPRVDELSAWAASFRRRYVAGEDVS